MVVNLIYSEFNSIDAPNKWEVIYATKFELHDDNTFTSNSTKLTGAFI